MLPPTTPGVLHALTSADVSPWRPVQNWSPGAGLNEKAKETDSVLVGWYSVLKKSRTLCFCVVLSVT